MKIVAISDTHGQQFSHLVPECDVLVHAGDISPMHDHSFWYQRQWFTDTFIPELKSCKAKNIIFIAGNHDFFLYDTYKSQNENWLRKQLPNNTHYLRDDGCVIDGVTFWGTPWVVNLSRWAFSKNEAINKYNSVDESDELRKWFGMIPNEVDFLISHGPANGFSDTIMEFKMTEHIGSNTLTEILLNKRVKYCLTGHIHSANHEEQKMSHSFDDIGNHTKFFCVSLLDESYKMKYQPKIITFEK